MPDFETQDKQVFIYTKAVNELVLNEAEEVALGNLYQSVSHAMGLGALNAIAAQQQNYVTAQAVTTMGATMLYSISAALGSTAGK
jgi:hypothetical protein